MESEPAKVIHIKSKKEHNVSITFCCCLLGFVFLCLFVVGFGLAKLVLGIIYIHDCELQPLLPVYLIIDCAAWMLVLSCICVFVHQDRQKPTTGTKVQTVEAAVADQPTHLGRCILSVSRLLTFLLLLFIFCWFIVGTVWAVDVKDRTSESGHCQTNTSSPSSTLSPADNFSLAPGAVTTPGHSGECVTCDPALVYFTFVVIIVQWAVLGVAVIGGVGALMVFGLILWLCSAVN